MRRYTVTTLLAAAFNVLVLVVISWGLMPQITRVARETEESRKITQESRDLLLDIRERSKRIDQEFNGIVDQLKGARKAKVEEQ